ncbi:MAG: hypothetical protein PHY93_04765 [Bacteriovorax sp.]|nr:hypothetical protein [Bacteriovorax sp.]
MKIEDFDWNVGNSEKFTFRAIDGLLKIRVISARYAHKKEAGKFHEKKTNS